VARSRVTNHGDLLPNLKGTSRGARPFRDLVNAFGRNLGGLGGARRQGRGQPRLVDPGYRNGIGSNLGAHFLKEFVVAEPQQGHIFR
jgi:hypothetical protein